MWPHNAVIQCIGKEAGPFPEQFPNKGKEPVTIARSAEEGTQELKKSSFTSMATHCRSSITSQKGSLTCVLMQITSMLGQEGRLVSDTWISLMCFSFFCCGCVYLLCCSFSFSHFLTLCFSSHFISYGP